MNIQENNKPKYAVFSSAEYGDYKVKDFEEDKEEAEQWAKNHAADYSTRVTPYCLLYPNGLFVKQISGPGRIENNLHPVLKTIFQSFGMMQ